jgi:hypothetical protein
MSEQSDGVVARLAADIQGPAGGWTMGVLTLFFTFATPVLVWLASGPSWLGEVGMVVFLVSHIIWGSAGYYPRSIR